MSDYWHRAYICPFWEAAGKKTIKCEDGCMLCFRESCDTAEYISRYCASYDYRKCRRQSCDISTGRHKDTGTEEARGGGPGALLAWGEKPKSMVYA